MALVQAKQMLTYENPRRAQLEPLIERARNGMGELLKTPYTGLTWDYLADPTFENAHNELRKTMQNSLAGKTLVDLGCNNGYYQWRTREIAIRMGIGRYIGIDLTADERELERDEIHISTVKADMLDFVSRLPSESANFMLNGIDARVIHDPAYHRELAAEIHRATERDGRVFGTKSEAFRFLERMGFTELEVNTAFHIFKKK
jgi:SAM-dependent methyltransferase